MWLQLIESKRERFHRRIDILFVYRHMFSLKFFATTTKREKNPVIIICYFKKNTLHKIIRLCCRKLKFYISACKERYYGRNCSLVCFPKCKSGTCQQTDRLCTCNAGWMGDNCTEGN